MDDRPHTLPVVVGVDEDPRTLGAVDWAAAESRRRRAPLLLLRVDPPARPPLAEEVLSRAECRARRVTDLPVQMLRRRGPLGPVLLEWAGHAALLVLGTRGPDPTTAPASSPLAVLADRAPCPLVVVDGARRGRGTDVGVLALVDAEPSTRAVLDWGLDLAARLAVPLTAVHAPRDLPGPVDGLSDEDEVLAWLDEDLGRLPHGWDVSLTDGLVESARRRHPGVVVRRVLDDAGAGSLLARTGEVAAALVTDAHHSRRLLDVITHGGNAYLTVVVPAAPVPASVIDRPLDSPVAAGLDALDTCGWALVEEPLPPARTRTVGPEPRTYEPALVPVRRSTPASRRHRSLWPDARSPRR